MSSLTRGALAEQTLAARLNRTANPTRYIAGFRTGRDRELALERERKTGVYIWTEPVAATVPSQFAGACEHYNAHAPRNSNLNAKNAPRLQVGHAVCYWRLAPETLPAFLDWYCAQ